MMRVALLFLALILCSQVRAAEAEAISCEDVLGAFQFSPDFDIPAIKIRFEEYKNEPRVFAVPRLRALLRSVNDEIARARQDYSAAEQLYREQYNLWERMDPWNQDRQAVSRQFDPLKHYLGNLNYYRNKIRSAINRLTSDDIESRVRRSGMVGDAAGTLTDNPMAIRSFSQGNFSNSGFSGTSW